MFRFWTKWRQRHGPGEGGPRPRPTGEWTCDPGEMELAAAVQTDAGCVREINEDCARFVRPGSPELLAAKGSLAIVADGMGGTAGGAVASRMAVDAIERLYYDSGAPAPEALKAAVLGANHEIAEAAEKTEGLGGMGTTCVVLLLLNGKAQAAHVGDSRLYLVRDAQIFRMTEDHSVVHEMVRRGLITPEEARQHDDRNVIFRSLGGGAGVEVSIWKEPLAVRPGDQFVLCSDGLHDLVEDETIREVVLASDPYAACENLIALARQRGGFDNITVVVVSVRTRQEQARRPARETREVDALT